MFNEDFSGNTFNINDFCSDLMVEKILLLECNLHRKRHITFDWERQLLPLWFLGFTNKSRKQYNLINKKQDYASVVIIHIYCFANTYDRPTREWFDDHI